MDKNQNRKAEIDKLYSDVQSYRNTENFKELMEFVKKFKNLAPFNAMLIHMQKPGSEFVASAEEWIEKFDRYPKYGARPLIILRQFGPVSFVYEYGDTEGKPLPDDLVKPFKTNDVVTESQICILSQSLIKEGILYRKEQYGTSKAGGIKRRKKIGEASFGKYVFQQRFDMVVNSAFSPTEQMATILHELAHLYCGHLGKEKDEKWIPERYVSDLNVREFEAETVCWLVCERLGIKNPSASYLSGYLNDNNKIPESISINTILKATDIIEKIVQGKNEKRKGLIIGNNFLENQISIF